jgi:2,5-diketo-D-gluconate reductase A
VDLYLLHQPMPTEFEATIGAYKALEKVLADGQARAIGVCNHKREHLENLMARTKVVPSVNQVEIHPYFSQPDLQAAHARYGIVTQAWSPIGGVNVYRPADPGAPKNPLADPTIIDLATKYGKTPAQVILRGHLQHGRCAIPKSVHANRIAENFDIFDFQLTEPELAAIDALDTGQRGGPEPDLIDTNTYPYRVEN